MCASRCRRRARRKKTRKGGGEEEEGVSMQKQCMRWTLSATARCGSRSTSNFFSLPSGSDSERFERSKRYI
jgi:hypothetical protein